MRRPLRKTAIMLLAISVVFIPGCAGKKEEASKVEDYICSVEKPKSGTTIEIRPEDDYTTILDTLKPGDELVLHEGTYIYPFKINVSGTPEKPIIIRGFGKGEKRPVFKYYDATTNLCEVYGNNLVIAYLEFQPIQQDINAIRLKPEEGGIRSNITIENCVFRDCGGGSIDANVGGGHYENIKILNNRFIGIKATPVYIGEHAGDARVDDFIFEGNFIDGSQIVREDVVGYGIELKLNVKGGVVRNNMIINTKGPGIMVYGATEGKPEDANIVEGNIVAGSRTSAGIEVGSGPSVVKNNIVVGCPGGGISVNNYGNRNLFENVTVTGNTAALNSNADFFVGQGYRDTDNLVVKNNLMIPSVDNQEIEGLDESNVKSVKGDNKLQELVEKLKKSSPDLAQLKEVWPEMKKGPYEVKKLNKILGVLVK